MYISPLYSTRSAYTHLDTFLSYTCCFNHTSIYISYEFAISEGRPDTHAQLMAYRQKCPLVLLYVCVSAGLCVCLSSCICKTYCISRRNADLYMHTIYLNANARRPKNII